ncbi:MAG: Unknown protein [uncultured Thiotrichaceae bacterium]|uniref:Uncharacterized protein n=1 Tax=uncultured Thiotrichaceae bacterium TaxID=298394 RepID=A0A6S6TGK8_9GAMM|nr:MAG: Unknown protein [uncultured Thiotrichaceae bacterium]
MKTIIFGVNVLLVSLIQVPVYSEELLFSSGFEDGVTIRTDNPYDPESIDYQFIWGQDVETGFTWPIDILGASQSSLHFVHGNPNEHLQATIETTQGHNGKDSKVLYTEKKKNGGSSTQIPYEILNLGDGEGAKSNLYTRYWLKVGSHSPDDQGVDWRALFEWKSKDYEYPYGHPKEGEITGDGLRLITYIYSDGNSAPYWAIKADKDYRVSDEDLNTDKNEDGSLDEATWYAENRQVPVPIDEWFLMEVYWYWDEGPNGSVVWKVNGQVIAAHEGPSTRNGKSIDFIMLTQTYGAQESLYQWVDDIEIWDSLPARYEDATELSAGDKVTSQVAQGQRVQYIVPARAGETVSAVLDRLSADADLYVKVGSDASGDSFDCAPWKDGTSLETCSVILEQDADVYIAVYGAQAATYQLHVAKEEVSNVALNLDKQLYALTGNMQISYTGMLGGPKDWLGIYKKGDNNDWGNVKEWSWSDGQVNGSVNLGYENLYEGDYEVRAFFNNSFITEKAVPFTVESAVLLTLDKQVYPATGTLQISYDGMLGGPADWFGIYKKDDDNKWENIKRWTWSDGQVKGSVSLSYEDLAAGEYELRVFFNNSFKLEKKASFTVDSHL